MIEISGLNKIYNKGKNNQVIALSDVNLDIESGEMLAIMGKSGAGKSTLLNVIGCVEQFDSGCVKIFGNEINKLNDNALSEIRNKTVSTIFQDFALIDDYTVIENVELPLLFAGIKGKKKLEMCKTALDKVNMSKYCFSNVTELSGGERQRVAIARAIVNYPKIILADEPTGALDSSTSKYIMRLLSDLNSSGITVIVVTHETEIADCCRKK